MSTITNSGEWKKSNFYTIAKERKTGNLIRILFLLLVSPWNWIESFVELAGNIIILFYLCPEARNGREKKAENSYENSISVTVNWNLSTNELNCNLNAGCVHRTTFRLILNDNNCPYRIIHGIIWNLNEMFNAVWGFGVSHWHDNVINAFSHHFFPFFFLWIQK